MKTLCLILFLALSATPACSRFSASGRQERAYAKYLRKSSGNREKQQAKFRQQKKAKIPKLDTAPPLEPRETTRTSEDPQGAPANPDNQ